jgi:hypothetical protein
VSAASTGTDVVFRSDGGRSNTLLFGIILMIVAESVGMHALLYDRWPYASLALLLLNAATIWWIVAELRAERFAALREDDVLVRFGRSISAELPLASVREASVPSWREVPGDTTPGYLRLAGGEDPNVLLRLDPPVAARLAFGIRKRVSLLGLRLDDPQGFVGELRQRLGT